MTKPRLVAIDSTEAPSLTISPRLRTQLAYFASEPGQNGDEFLFSAEEVATILDEGVIRLVSPLDTANATEVEIDEEQEAMLSWLARYKVGRVRVVD